MKQTNTSSIRYQDRPYRPCVGIMLINQQGDIFGGQRLDNRAEAWQMPQGGIDEGEDVETACFREMREEIGTNKADILRLHPNWLNYDIPQPLADNLWSGAYRGKPRNGWPCALQVKTQISISRPKILSLSAGNGCPRMSLFSGRCRLNAMCIQI